MESHLFACESVFLAREVRALMCSFSMYCFRLQMDPSCCVKVKEANKVLVADEVIWVVYYVLYFSSYLASLCTSSLQRIFVCALTLRVVLLWWDFIYLLCVQYRL